MARVFDDWCRPSLLVGALVLVAGCGETFVATTSSGGGGGSAPAGGGGGTTTTTSATTECKNGETRKCYDGPPNTKDIGQCKSGTQTCDSSGKWRECEGQVLPGAAEVCDEGAKDENCNGSAQEGCTCTPGDEMGCYGGLPETKNVGLCHGGTMKCVNAMWSECKEQTLPVDEICDEQDNDCNGSSDDFDGLGEECATGNPGVCAAGILECVPGAPLPKCMQIQQSATEVCDMKDNDCNGAVDETFPQIGVSCEAAVGGTLCSGHHQCTNGTVSCLPKPAYVADDFGGNALAWTADSPWAIGAAVVSAGHTVGFGDPGEDHTPSADNKLAGTVIGGNLPASLGLPAYLTSKEIDVSNVQGTLYLNFWRWLNVDGGMLATVEVFNGTAWIPKWQSAGMVDPNEGAGVFDDAWEPRSIEITDLKSSKLRVRFGLAPAGTNQSLSGWNVDDVALASCPLPNGLAMMAP